MQLLKHLMCVYVASLRSYIKIFYAECKNRYTIKKTNNNNNHDTEFIC